MRRAWPGGAGAPGGAPRGAPMGRPPPPPALGGALLLAALLFWVGGARAAAWGPVRHNTSLKRTQASGVRCKTTAFGWMCDPNNKAMEDFVRMGAGVDLGAESGLEAVSDDQCCTPDCVEADFQQMRKEALKAGGPEFYVDMQQGDDRGPGTRELPWRTLNRAHAEVRALRVASSDDLKLTQPVQVWIKDPSSFARPGSWHGTTFRN